MPEPSVRHDAIINAIMANAGRSTLPFQQAHADRWHGTAFWFNDLLDSASGSEVISQYLVTAAGMTRYDLGELTLRPELCEPEMSAEKLLMTDFAEGWTVLGDLGVAVMPTAGLHAHGRRKGWSWATDEITDGLAARHEDIARIGAEPRPAYILGHDVGEQDGERLQAVVVGRVARGADGHVHWDSTVPEGCAGAPVFVGEELGDDRFRLVCVGLVLPGAERNRIATFDRIRTAVRESGAGQGTEPVTSSLAEPDPEAGEHPETALRTEAGEHPETALRTETGEHLATARHPEAGKRPGRWWRRKPRAH
ncbi:MULTISPECIES: hypothetical protein [unclassified Streptomyces]|uniref:hypothetical protein n=1 Tax=unclassified Streptomyces TaxID=2593676 RepID=UPI0029B870B6|nr:hypothetical protein [Streptomyces sp. ME01-18a]MDX3433664.1 hypothetical protein [Streptomyces sp. ME01-18a]WSS78098.1 hypothetical protein OG414_23980 [Streptomyces sp. NBC_01174]